MDKANNINEDDYVTNRIESMREIFYALICGLAETTISKYSEQEKNYLCNYAMLCYLRIWLEKATNARQTVTQFLKLKPTTLFNGKYEEFELKYALSNEKIDFQPHRRSDEQGMLRALKVLIQNRALQNQQARNEETHYKRIPYSKNGKRKWDFIDLCFADAYRQEYLYLYKLFYIYKNPFPCDTGKSVVNRIIFAYGMLGEYIEDICKDFQLILDYQKAMNEKTRLPKYVQSPPYIELRKRRVVIGSLFLHQFEYTYRFFYVLEIAKQMRQNGIDDIKKIPQFLIEFVQRADDIWRNQKIGITCFIAPYENIVISAMNNKITREDELKALEATWVINYAISAYRQCNPKNEIRDLTAEDFEHMLEFLINDFHIMEILQGYKDNIHILSEDNLIAAEIKKIYSDSGIISSESMLWAHEKIKTAAKKNNKR